MVLTVKQEAGELFFRMDDSEKTKQFAQEGGTQIVALQTNLESYEVVAPAWCTISEKTNEGFKITAEANSDFRREETLLVRAQGSRNSSKAAHRSASPKSRYPPFLEHRWK